MTLDKYCNKKDKEHNFSINIEFDTKINVTSRILEISEAFGLGIDEMKKFVVYKDFNIGFNKGDVIYITGDSGGGKTILLKYLQDKLENTIDLSDIIPEPDEQIIESIGQDLNESVYYLSMMGLNDAFIFLRKYKELSDGQKYRYRLAKALSMNPYYLFVDEFCANLDRTTAKVISYNLQKICRKNNITLCCATTHTDIEYDLNPSVKVLKKFMDDVYIEYNDYVARKISFYSDIYIEEGNISDFHKLKKYHYKNTSTRFPYCKIVRATLYGELIGIAVYSPPFLQTKGRTIKFNKKYSLMTKPIVAEINKLFIRRSRNIVSPKYRGCGLGQKLALDSMAFVSTKKYVEAINIMGKYTPVNDKIGMERIEITEETDSAAIKLDKWLKENNCVVKEINNSKYWTNWIKTLSSKKKNELKLLTGKVLHHPKIGISSKDGKRAEVVKQEKRYKEVDFKEVRTEIISYIPKLYAGMTLYYIMNNPFYKEVKEINLGDFNKQNGTNNRRV